MELKTIQTVNTAVLVIGGGGAGLRAAIEAKKYGLDVLLVSKSRVGYGNNTAIAGGGWAVAGIGNEPDDSPEVHFKDTIKSGQFINDQKLVRIMTQGAAQQVSDLTEFGVKFKKRDSGLLRGPGQGHTYRRGVSGDRIGTYLTEPMRDYATSIGIQFKEGVLITKLLKTGDTVVGAFGIGKEGQVFVFKAKSTILATGGAGEVYLRTDNAAGSTGDGYALAYECGTSLQDMEFVQFFPTTVGKHGKKVWGFPNFLREGAVLRNSLGEDILKKHGTDDLASMTRDKLSRAVMTEIIEGRGVGESVVVDYAQVPAEKFKELRRDKGGSGYSEETQVAPSAHFFMGGVKINENCETGIDGLYAAGEICSGVQGANRLGGNALTEVFVFGAIAGGKAAARALEMEAISANESEISAEVKSLRELASRQGGEILSKLRQSLKETMWYKAGIIRNKDGLEEAIKEIGLIQDRLNMVSVASYSQLIKAIELSNMLTVSEAICRGALKRTESRGAHYRTDYPEENNEQWLKNIDISCVSGNMTLRVIPVTIEPASEYIEPD